MISHLSVQNFRCHQDVDLKHCGRVNVLLGKNNAGKTAILEAILILCFPPNPRDVLLLMNEQRGYQPGDENDELWDSYFTRWDSTRHISLRANEAPANANLIVCQNVVISPMRGFDPRVVSGSVIEGRSVLDKTLGLKFKYAYSSGPVVEREITSLKRKPGKVINGWKNLLDRISPIAFIPSKGISNAQADAERFSRLEKDNLHHEVENALRGVEPRLKRLTVLASGKGSMVYGDLGEEHLTPISLMGEGMVRMLAIATAMASNREGIVLIDEIENGLHYTALPSLWKMIFETAARLDVQVFAATHSDECLRAASQMARLQDAANALRLFRLDLRNGITSVTDYTAEELAAAMASDQEVR